MRTRPSIPPLRYPPLAALLLAALLLVAARGPVSAQEAEPPPLPSPEQVQGWIEDLGAEDFARRERAEAALEALGIEAFDALREASQHPDIEIARRAGYLLRRFDVVWYRESDSENVKAILEGYSGLSRADRGTRIDSLASLPMEEAAPVLCRIARFESEARLAKRAAIRLIRRVPWEELDQAAELGAEIREAVGPSRRASVRWLREFARTLEQPQQSPDAWQALLQEEQQVHASFPGRTSDLLLLELMRFQAELALSLGQRDQGLAIAERTFELVPNQRAPLLTQCDWLLDRGFAGLLESLVEQNAFIFQQHLDLQYRRAEAYRRNGDETAATQVAEAALASLPDQYEEHLEAATSLQTRGMLDWSEAEFRMVAEADDEHYGLAVQAVSSLAELLHDEFRELEAAETLKQLSDRVGDDEEERNRLARIRAGGIEPIRSRMHYFFAIDLVQQGEYARAKVHLEQGFNAYPRDVDVLIAMYRLPPQEDPDYHAQALERIRGVAGYLLSRARYYEQQRVNFPHRSDQDRLLAYYDNQYAWLIGNTEGDYDEALARSWQSLEFFPDASGYWDTLGRCYFALGQLEEAVKYQSHAVKLEPHSGQIQRQLEEFQLAWDLSQRRSP